jgi:flagellar basal-body rod protein FlgB
MVNKPSIVEILEAGMSANALRQKAVANNLANLNTPGFRRDDVSFEDILARKLDRAKGIERKELEKLSPELFKPMETPVKGDGNDVDLDIEVGALLKTAGRQKTYLRVLNKLYKQMEMAIQERV